MRVFIWSCIVSAQVHEELFELAIVALQRVASEPEYAAMLCQVDVGYYGVS